MSFSPELLRGTVVPIVLSLLSEQAMYGYQIVKKVDQRSGGVLQFKEGTLYPVLHKLEDQKLIRSSWEAGDFGKPRKYYQITAQGQRHLEKSRTEWVVMRSAVDLFLLGS